MVKSFLILTAAHIQVEDQVRRRRTITNLIMRRRIMRSKAWGRLPLSYYRPSITPERVFLHGRHERERVRTEMAARRREKVNLRSKRWRRRPQWWRYLFPVVSMDLPPKNWCGVPLPKVCKVHSKSWSQNEDRNGSRARRPRRALSLYRISNSNRQRLSSPKDDHSNRIYCYTRWETMELQLLRLW